MFTLQPIQRQGVYTKKIIMKLIVSLSVMMLVFLTLASCAQKTSDKSLGASSQQKGKQAILPPADLEKLSKATFASGCFWCVEAVFESVKGVKEAVSGYAGGTEANPNYEQVGGGSTSHSEAVEVYYDPAVVSYETLLKVYFASMDPTQVNGQGPDRGRQYRSILFYRNETEKAAIDKYIKQLNSSGKYNAPISVEVAAYDKFWDAEKYHQNYVVINPDAGYVRGESIPRVKRFQAQMPELIKPERKF